MVIEMGKSSTLTWELSIACLITGGIISEFLPFSQGFAGDFLKSLASHICGCHSETMTEEESLGFSEDL